MAVGPLLAVGAGLNMASSFMGASEQNEQIRAQQQQMFQQANELDIEGSFLRKEGAAKERLMRDQGSTMEGQQKSAAVSSGVKTQGSVMDAIKESAFNLELDALNTREQYTREALSKERSADNLRAGIPQERSGLGTLLSAAGTGIGAYSQYKMFGGN